MERYATELADCMEIAHNKLWFQQLQLRMADCQWELSFKVEQLIWIKTKHLFKGQSHKLQLKYTGLYTIEEVNKNHTYIAKQHGRCGW